MILTFLSADVPLAKSYSLDSDGNLVKESYPRAFEFASRTVEVANLQDFAEQLKEAAANGECLLKGSVNRPLVSESRAGSTDANALTSNLCLDFDRLPAGVSLSRAISALGLAEYSHVVQYSASFGIERDRGETGHVFFFLTQPFHPAAIKQWLIAANLKTDCLRTQVGLTKTNNALSWPLDVSTCQNDKLIYISPPIVGDGVTSVFSGERIQVVERSQSAIAPSSLSVPSAEENRGAINVLLDGLRARAGLPARKWVTSIHKGTGLEILQKPDQATLSNIKHERGFTYFNLNGGDSWGYFHPVDNPDVIRNFKGEPYYATKELLPEYWAQLQSKARATEPDAQATVVIAIRDFRTSTYYNGLWDPNTNNLELARASSELQLQHFLVENGRQKQDIVPAWDLIFDPQSEKRVDTVRKTINLFEPSIYMKQKVIVPVTDFKRMPLIHRIIEHALSHDVITREHFLNWVACVFNLRARTQTAWVLHGIEGTGKGLLLHKILKPLLGVSNVDVVPMRLLEDRFNDFVERSLLVVVEEAEINESKQASMIMASLKTWITEPIIVVRKMFTAPYKVDNHCNFVLNSNKTAPAHVSQSDRRFNIGQYQAEKLEITRAEIALIVHELPVFADYLHTLPADLDRASQVLETRDRAEMMAASMTSIELTARALTQGNLRFFWDALPAGEAGLISPEQAALSESYLKIIKKALRERVQLLTRDELRMIFTYNVGDIPRSPTKFRAFLNHYRLHLKDEMFEVKWEPDQEWLNKRLKETT